MLNRVQRSQTLNLFGFITSIVIWTLYELNYEIPRTILHIVVNVGNIYDTAATGTGSALLIAD